MLSRFAFRAAALAVAVAGFALTGLAGPAAAQSSGNQQSAQQSQQQTPDYADTKLQSFAMAAIKVRSVMEEYRPQLQQARQNQDREQFEQVRQQARQAVEQEISKTEGITSQEYQQIAQDARDDDQLREKLIGMMEARQQDE